MDNNYEFTGKTKIVDNHTLHRIRCTKKVHKNVDPGDLGGWIETIENLNGNAWVGDNAKVYGKAKVFGNAWVGDNAKVYGKAKVFGNARICNDAEVYGEAKVFGNTEVYDGAELYDEAQVYGEARIFGSTEVYGEAKVFGNTWIYGSAEICSKAWVYHNMDYCCFQSFGSDGRTTTVFRESDESIRVKCGCFFGTLEEFRERVEKQHGDTQFGKEYRAMIDMIKIRFPIKL
jgi:carbonic anhydrase/acetyltransferase-like protein (isoleucine patch superfamily)